jgi:DMSO/TMAO reductase YedYZ molybdopterin-dependent catalytic subunit
MNDQPLPQKHGFPVRLLVPGWYGMASVKWLDHITALKTPFKGPFQTIDYVYLPKENDYQNATPVTEIKINSMITFPSPGLMMPKGSHTIRGMAWTGKNTISQVEVSTDWGATWSKAKLTSPEHDEFNWTLWEYEWSIKIPGKYTIMARAIDSQGNIQPMKAEWNAKGYANNSIHQVNVEVPSPPPKQ